MAREIRRTVLFALGIAAWMSAADVFFFPGWGRADELERLTLRGLKEMGVLVELLAPSIERAGLTWQEVRTEVESELRTGGIKLLPLKEASQIPGRPYLYVEVLSKVSQAELFALHIRLSLKQSVLLSRSPQAETVAPTWSKGITGAVGPAGLKGFVRDELRRLLRQFIADYSTANPR